MNIRLFLLLMTVHVLDVSGQGMVQQISDYLKGHKIPHYSYKDSLKSRKRSGYFMTNRKGQTTLSLPKGAVDISVPVGDSVVYGKIKSPLLMEDAKGQLIVTEYADGIKVKDELIGMGIIKASVGVCVDWSIDNKDATTMNLYFLGGHIISCPLKRNPAKLVQAFFLNENLKSVKMGQEIKTCLLYEDTKEGKIKHMLEQWIGNSDEKGFMTKVAVGLKSYYVISYKLEKL